VGGPAVAGVSTGTAPALNHRCVPDSLNEAAVREPGLAAAARDDPVLNRDQAVLAGEC
jgi:hypothetical protein